MLPPPVPPHIPPETPPNNPSFAVESEDPTAALMETGSSSESQSRSANRCGSDARCPSCLAEQLWLPFRILAMNPLVTFICFIVIDAIFICLWVTLRWIADKITRPGLFLALCLLAFLLIRFITLAMTYPGQLRVVMRDTERNFGKLLVRRVSYSMDIVETFLEVLQDPAESRNRKFEFFHAHDDLENTLQQIIRPLVAALTLLESEHRLSSDGKAFLEAVSKYLVEVERLNVGWKDLRNEGLQTFEAVRMENYRLLEEDLSESSSTLKESMQDLVAYIYSVKELIPFILNEPTTKRSGLSSLLFKWWEARQPLEAIGCLDLMRADLAVRFNGQQVWVPTPNPNYRIDGMFIPALGLTTSSENTHRTLILCNPNAGLYEFHHFQSEWVSYYTQLGCNVFLFNYRGYGRNAGVSSPHANNEDGMAIVKYLKEVRRIERLAIHGESIGGLVATHVANHCSEIELLVADRTFANLPSVAQRLVAGWAGKAVACTTRWNTDNVTNFTEANCYKIICSDPKDEIIADASSLKTGVALRHELEDHSSMLPASHNTMIRTRRQSFTAAVGIDDIEKQSRLCGVVEVPVVGSRLDELQLFEFYLALMQIASALSKDADLPPSPDSDEVRLKVTDEQEPPCALSSPSLREDLAVVWKLIASTDGYCGELLVSAFSRGFEGIRSWVVSMLLWSPSLAAYKDLNPYISYVEDGQNLRAVNLSIVIERLSDMRLRHTELFGDARVCYVYEFLKFLWNSHIERLQCIRAADEAMQAVGGDKHADSVVWYHPHRLGYLIPLHCGHNSNPSKREKTVLTRHLRRSGWITQTEQ